MTVNHSVTTTPLSETLAIRRAFAGTWLVLRFMLRRDRVYGPAWVLGMTMMLAYFANALGLVLDQESLESFAIFAKNPVVALVGGPGYGFDHITTARFLVGVYGSYLMIGAALMSIMTVSRHTRVEEQNGRAELIRASIVGRHAQLAAAIMHVTLLHAVMVGLMAIVFYTSATNPEAFSSSLLFACSIGAVGFVFAGVSALTVHLSPFSRVGAGIAGVALAAGFACRGFADMSFMQQGKLGWLTWLSPLGWSQQTAPFTLDRWWPLAISLGAALVLIATGFVLESRRDFAAGILAEGVGASQAPAWFRTPGALAFRLQCSGISWWSLAMFLGGATFGAFVHPMAQNAKGMPEEIVALFGGAQGMIDGYLGFMGIYFALIVVVYAILSVHTLRAEEFEGRAEPLIASVVSRTGWLLSWVGVTGFGVLWLMFLAGAGTGLGASSSTGEWQLFGPTLLGVLVQATPVWALLGFAAGLYGIAPRLIGVTWALFVYSAVLSLFGELMQLDDWVLNTSLFRHVGQYPAESISWVSAGLITGLGILCAGAGAVSFRRRDLTAG